jgi:hypothetical protein
MWPALVEQAQQRGAVEVSEMAQVAWDVFISQPGQAEHWCCACGLDADQYGEHR